MKYEIKEEKNKAILTITIPAADVEAGMHHAAEHMSQDSSIPGFRPGKAPYEVVKQRVGEMALLEHAAEELIRAAFVDAMLKEDLETVGQPFFNAEKMAPGNDLIFTVEIALLPKVKKLADLSSLSVEKKETKPTEEAIERAKKDLAMMQTKEVRKESGNTLEKGDKVVVDLTMKKDGVVLEGGEGQSHGIYTAEPYYIDGFIEKIIGKKEGETAEFTLPFPKDHFQKHLAGADVDFEVAIKEIFSLDAPKIDDAFAKKIGLKDAKELEAKLQENLQAENESEERKRLEQATIEAVISKSDIEEIPDILINQEVNRMIGELEQQVTSQGQKFDDYLQQIGKGIAELKLDFTPTALKRVQASIIIKEIAKQENLSADEKTIDSELEKVSDYYSDNKEAQEQISSPQYRDYVAQQLTNRNVIEYLIKEIVK